MKQHTVIHTGYNLIYAISLFDTPCHEWRNKSIIDKTIMAALPSKHTSVSPPHHYHRHCWIPWRQPSRHASA
jgi:hypothetical protein